METSTALLIGTALAVLVLLVLAWLVVLGLRDARTARTVRVLALELEATRAELIEVRDRLEELARHRSSGEIVITEVGAPTSQDPKREIAEQVVLTATLGEPLVKAVSFGHGLRRALSAESRNRIWFEMRREVRRARKQRRRDVRSAYRRMHLDPDAPLAGEA